MANRTLMTGVALTLVFVLALSLAAPRPAQANDLGKILAGAAVGYLVFSALDSSSRSSGEVYRSYNPPRGQAYGHRETPKQVYDQGYQDGWRDGERYGYREGWQDGERYGARQGYRQGWNDGYREGYRDGSWPRGPSYSPPGGGWRYGW